MRHKVKGRTLGRNASHRRAMFRNMAASLINTVVIDEADPKSPKVAGRIVTTVPKAKELRPFVERLITLAKKSLPHSRAAESLESKAERNSTQWKEWRKSPQYLEWNQAIAPAVAYRRRAFALLRDKDAVRLLFEILGPRFEARAGGYTRIIKLATVRLGDAGAQAFIEFVGTNDRVKRKRLAPVLAAPVVTSPAVTESAPPAAEPSDTPSES